MSGGFPHFAVVKNAPTNAVWSLGGKDPLEKEMATHSSILAWRIPWTEEPRGSQSWTRLECLTEHWLPCPEDLEGLILRLLREKLRRGINAGDVTEGRPGAGPHARGVLRALAVRPLPLTDAWGAFWLPCVSPPSSGRSEQCCRLFPT